MSASDLILKNPLVALGAAVAIIAVVWIAKNGAKNAGAQFASGAVNGLNGVIGGGVTALGGIFGVPATDAQKGAAALASGNMFDASLYLPAGKFVAAAVGDTAVNPLQGAGAWVGKSIYNITH